MTITRTTLRICLATILVATFGMFLPERSDAQPPDQDIKEFVIRNLGPVVNSLDLEYAPTITADGKTLYFVSNRAAAGAVGGHDFWVTTKANRLDTIFTAPFNLGAPINTTLNEGVASISADGQVIYFTACNRADGVGDCDIYEAELDGTEWVNVRNLREINSSDWDSQPSISSDGNTLYFISNRPGAMGGADDADIYMSRLQSDGSWSEPVNLGEPINTEEREDSPFIFPGGKVMYFASAGHGGYGGLDFFVTRMQDDGTWSAPENIGEPFNTKRDERFITLPAAGDVIYFASERTDVGNEGTLDIYMGILPPRTTTLMVKGRIYDVCTDGNLPGELTITNRNTGEVLQTISTNSETGEYSFVMDVEQNEAIALDIAGDVPGYGAVSAEVLETDGLTEYREFTRDFPVGEVPTLSFTAPKSDYIANLPATATNQYPDFEGLVIEEILVREIYPLLTYVFFDSGSATIPGRYKLFTSPAQTKNFTDTTIPGGTLQKYYHMLNIVGFRMQKYPEATITIQGHNLTAGKGSTVPVGAETPEVAAQRADVVYDYLTRIWEIDPSRIKMLKHGNLPKERSNPADPLGKVENQRVEIYGDNMSWEIMKPILEVEIRAFHSPLEMTFQMKNGIADQLVARREIRISREGDPNWHTMTDIGTTDPSSPAYNWFKNGDEEEAIIADDETPYKAQMIVYSNDGRECRSNIIEIPVLIFTEEEKRRERHELKTIDRYSLVLFKFDSDEAGPLNERVLSTFVYDDIRKGAQIKVTGYTDVVGLEDRNLRLSEQRAATVDRGLKKNVSRSLVASQRTEGVGETQPLFSNDLPEGRFYNRTVQIVVETPN